MDWEPVSARENRGLTPVVAIVLLFGIVAVGATLTVVAGMGLMDTIDTQTDIEQTQQNFDVTSQQLEQAVMTGDPQGLPDMTGSSELNAGTTTIEFKRADVDFGDAEYDSGWEVGSDSYAIDLNAVEYRAEGGDQRFVFEGGGQWQVSDEQVTIQSAPQFRFSYDETLGLDVSLTNVDEDSRLSGTDVVARSDGPGSNAIDEEALIDALEYEGSDGGEDIVIEIETEYYDAWEAALDRHSDLDHEDVRYYHDREEDVLRVAIDQLAIERTPTFTVESIDTVTETVEHGESLEVAVTVENTGFVEGSTDIDMTIADDAPVTLSTGTLSPGESETLTFEYASNPGGGGADGSLVDVDAISNQKHQDVDQYDEYEFEVTTDDDRGVGSFLFSQPEPFFRIEEHSYDSSSGVVTADLTNISGDAHEYDVTFTLEGQSDDGEIEISEERTLEDVSQRSWEDSTYQLDIDRDRLPYGEYTYTIDVSETNFPAAHNNNSDASIATGTFELSADDGVGAEPGEIVVEEPTDVSVNLIGTEISAERNLGGGAYDKYWAPVTASAVVGDERYRFMPDGSTEKIPLDQPHYTPSGTTMGDFDLNTYDTQDRIYEFEDEIEEGSVTIEATYWRCEHGAFSNRVATDGELSHYDCANGNLTAPTTIDVAGDDAAVDSGFLMTRDQERNDLPDIEKGYPLQRGLQEVFEDGAGVDIEDDGLQLGTQDFAFMMEVTMNQDGLAEEYDWGGGYDGEYADAFDSDDQTRANLAAWDIAKDHRDSSYSDTNDPNFNDVIGYVEADPGDTYLESEDPLHNDPTIDGEQRSVDTETSGVSGRDGDGSSTVDVGVDEIVIG